MPRRFGSGDSYIITLDYKASEAFIFFFKYFDRVSDNAVPGYSAQEIVGRSNPIFTYQQTGPRTISLSIDIPVSVDQGDVSSNSTWGTKESNVWENGTAKTASSVDTVGGPGGAGDAVIQAVSALRSLAYPDYSTARNFILPPSRVLLSLGDFLKMTSIVTSVSVTWQKPWRDGIPMLAHVDLAFSSVPEYPNDCYAVKNGLDDEVEGSVLGQVGTVR
jgi:hypothetical protein